MPIQNAFVKFTYIPRAQYTALTKDANTYYAVVETDGKLRYYLGSTEFSYLPLTGGTLTDDLMMAFADGADPRPSKNILFQGRIGGTPYTKALNMGADGILKFNGTAISLDGHTHGSYNRATSVLTGANVFSDIVVSNGIVTSISTRALTVSDIGAAAASHSHGSIANDGTIAVTAVTPASTDYLLISDTSDSSRIARGILIGSGTTTYLRNDGTWGTPAGTYSLPLAANGTRGGIQIGYAQNAKNYPVQLSGEKAYVNVPWTDTVYTISKADVESVLTGNITTHTHSYLPLTGGTLTGDLSLDHVSEDATSDSRRLIFRARAVSVDFTRDLYINSAGTLLFNSNAIYHAGNNNIGTGATNFAAGNHAHGNITTDGKIGSTSGLVVITTTSGVLTTLAAGTTAQFLRGDGTWQTPSYPVTSVNGYTGAVSVLHLRNTDDRDVKPNVVAYNRLQAFFTSLEGLTGAAGTDYQDLLVLNTYTDASGGDMNALAFDKSEMKIRHYFADQAATSWGTPKTLAYAEDVALATHTHGNISSDGKIGGVSGLVVITTTNGLLTTLAAGSAGQFLAHNGTWGTPAGTYSLPLAANGTRGGIQIGYAQNAKNYPVQLSGEKAYVNVPWTDTVYVISKADVESVLTGDITSHTHTRFNKDAHNVDTSNYSLEFLAPEGTASGELSIRFHQSNRWYGQLRASSSGFKFTNGDSGTTQAVTAQRFISDVATGTAPFTVTSTTVVTNLNADSIDGYHSTSLLAVTGNAPTDVNTAGLGIWRINTAHTNMPVGFTGSYGTLVSFDNSSDTGFQLLVPNFSDNRIFMRTGNPAAYGGSGTFSSWVELWHTGNDGAGTGLDADTVDGYHANAFYLATNPNGYISGITKAMVETVLTGTITTHNHAYLPNSGAATLEQHAALGSVVGSVNTLQILQSTASNDAFMTFHIANDYAVHFGLDYATNDLFVGGWSMGANKYKIWHQNNDGAGSGLDADLLDGQHGSYYAAASSLASYLPLTGGTLTGNLTLDHTTPVGGQANSRSIVFTYQDVSVDYTKTLYVNPSGILLFGGTGVILGSGTANQIAYFSAAGTIASLSTATYPSLTELSYVKGVTSAIQTQLGAKQATITGAATTIVSSNLTASRVLVSDGSGKVAASSITSTTLGYLDATSSIQTQLNGKQATITGAATTIVSSNLTASRLVVSDGSGKIAAASVTATEAGYLSGVTSAIQTQLNGKAPIATPTFTTADADLAIGSVSNKNRIQSYSTGTPIRFLNSANGYAVIAADDLKLGDSVSVKDNMAYRTVYGTALSANTSITTTYANRFVRCTNGAGVNITLTIGTGFTVGDEIHFSREGVGEVTIALSSGTLNSESSKRRINALYQVVTAKYVAANVWLLFGALKT